MNIMYLTGVEKEVPDLNLIERKLGPIPKNLKKIIMGCWQYDPVDRISAQDIIQRLDGMEEDMEFMNFTDSVEEVQNSQKISGDSELIMPRPLSMGRRPMSVVNDASFSRGYGDGVRTVAVNVHNTGWFW